MSLGDLSNSSLFTLHSSPYNSQSNWQVEINETTFTNTTTGRAAEVAIANVSRKFRREYNAGEMPVSQFTFYLDGKSDEAHRTLHALGIKDYTELAITEIIE